MRAGTALIEGMLATAVDNSPELEDVLHHIIKATVAFHTSAPRLHHVLLFEAPRTPEVLELMHHLEDSVTTIVEELLVRQLGIEGRHASHAAYLIVHVVNILTHEFVLHPPRDMDEDEFVAEVATMLGAYLLAPCPGRR